MNKLDEATALVNEAEEIAEARAGTLEGNVVKQLEKAGWWDGKKQGGVWRLRSKEDNQARGQKGANDLVKWLKSNGFNIQEDHRGVVHATNGDVYLRFDRTFDQNPVTKHFQSSATVYTKEHEHFDQMVKQARLKA
jgi:hypothetical protein